LCNCLIIQNLDNNNIVNDSDNKISIPPCYLDYIEVFDEKNCDKLPPLYREFDCEINLKDNSILFYGPIYPLTEEERDELKKYINVTKSSVSKIRTLVQWLVTLTMTNTSWVRLTPQPILHK